MEDITAGGKTIPTWHEAESLEPGFSLADDDMVTEKLPQYLSTTEAAKMLGMSTSLVQSLVDAQQIQGWKTRGGHRRISLESVMDYQNHIRHKKITSEAMRRRPRVMLVAEDPHNLDLLQKELSDWTFLLECIFFDSVAEGLTDLSATKPDLLVIELSMPLEQQEKTLCALQNFNARSRKPMSMVVLTQEANQLASGQQHDGNFIQLMTGPLRFLWLQGCFTGYLAARQSTQKPICKGSPNIVKKIA